MTSTARLNAVVDGPEDGPVVVLGPSLGTDLGLFAHQVAPLAETHRVIRYDLRGHGDSEVVPGPCTMADLAGDVLALLDSLGADRFAYAGVSIGGAIGLQLALTVPDRVERLAMLASAAQFADAASYTARAQQVRADGTEFLVPSRTGLWFTAAWAEEHPDDADRLRQMLRDTPAEGYAACCEAIGVYDVRGRLGEVGAPALLIAGEHDPATTAALMQSVADGLRGATFHIVPGAAHLPNYTNPAAVNRELIPFLTG